jgi:ubiquinone/menaquinone biosynthesis C-methylase UbiE
VYTIDISSHLLKQPISKLKIYKITWTYVTAIIKSLSFQENS